jgi:hypothetical protein
MARKYDYQYGAGKTAYGWGMEQCEERLLWAAYCEIESKLGAEQQAQKAEFLDAFLHAGMGVKFDTVAWINSRRKRQNLEPIEFTETNIYEYGRMTDRALKAELRNQMKKEYFLLDAVGRVHWKHQAEDEMRRLPPPHNTWEEIRVARTRSAAPSLTNRERQVRLHVVDQAKSEPESEPEEITMTASPAVTKALRQLKLAKKPDTIARIISSLAPDDALTLAEEGAFDDADLVDALVERSITEG